MNSSQSNKNDVVEEKKTQQHEKLLDDKSKETVLDFLKKENIRVGLLGYRIKNKITVEDVTKEHCSDRDIPDGFTRIALEPIWMGDPINKTNNEQKVINAIVKNLKTTFGDDSKIDVTVSRAKITRHSIRVAEGDSHHPGFISIKINGLRKEDIANISINKSHQI